jgi:hypothetical protein
MNLGETIDNFNVLSQTLFKELASTTKNKRVKTLSIKSKMAVSHKPKILITNFIDTFYKYRHLVHERDYKYFDENINEVVSSIRNDDLSVLFNAWGSLTAENKKVMFMYISELLNCCDTYMEIVVGNKRLTDCSSTR